MFVPTAVAMVGFNPTTYSVNEGESATILVQLFSMIERPVTVNFQTVDGSAVSNSDYTAVQKSITFQPGSPITIDFTIVPTAMDTLPELTEQFLAELFQAEPAGRVTITEDTATVQITDTSGTY